MIIVDIALIVVFVSITILYFKEYIELKRDAREMGLVVAKAKEIHQAYVNDRSRGKF